ncbi:uncharacterized protein CTRU02_212713 [Colletotrichum truncatum]|uniref:Uncharacterized protein n=1 Tax=Colletotrichum truncatum TaxID=5467 RepID=A0ACC3YIN0_COLTU
MLRDDWVAGDEYLFNTASRCIFCPMLDAALPLLHVPITSWRAYITVRTMKPYNALCNNTILRLPIIVFTLTASLPLLMSQFLKIAIKEIPLRQEHE